MKILIICGSIAKKAHTRGLLKYAEKLLKDKKVEVVFWDLLTKPLPFAIPEFHKNPSQSPDQNVKLFLKEVDGADGFVLGSPLYQGSFSGVLKNALDNLYYDAFRNKPVALVSNSSSIRNCAHPCEHLRLVVRALYGYVLQSQIGTTDKDYEETQDGYALENQEIKERVARQVDELINFAKLLKENAINKN